jgi:hypothetical protein
MQVLIVYKYKIDVGATLAVAPTKMLIVRVPCYKKGFKTYSISSKLVVHASFNCL